MVITVIGPHATGKTTAFENCLMPWLYAEEIIGVTIVNCDNSRESYYQFVDMYDVLDLTIKKRKQWQGSSDEKLKEFMECAEDPDILYICETAWADHIRFAGIAHEQFPGDVLPILVLPTWKIQKRFMIERCQQKNKEFRADYWTDKRLQYESQNRFLNAAKRYLEPVGCDYNFFEMDYERKNWDKVIEFIKWETGRMLQ